MFSAMMIKKVFFLFIITMLSFGQFNLAEVATLFHQIQYFKDAQLVLDYLTTISHAFSAL